MLGIGKPANQDRPFANVQMTPKPDDIGDQLNKISGNKDKLKYVDAKTHNKMGKDEFLKLLTFQLSNQDPTNPMDQKQFAADLAQFSQLEQMANMNSTLEKQNESKPLENKYYAASFLGKEVITSGTTLELKEDGESKDIPFYLPSDAKNLMIRVYDSKNQMIAQIEKENISKGSNSIRWDGGTLDGSTAGKGAYTIDVRAWDENYGEFKAETKSSGVVTDVAFENGETVLKLDGKKSIFLRDVESFKLVRDNKNVSDDAAMKAAMAYKKLSQ